MPDFRALLLSFAVNRTGDQLGIFALAIVVYDRTGSALATAALFLATEFGPGLLGPFVVSRTDHLQLGRVLPAFYAVEAILFALLALIAPHGAVVVVIVVAFADATLAFTARVLTRSGAASTLLDRDLLAEGKSAFNVTFAIATTGGPALAAALVATGGIQIALGLDSASFVVAALLVARAPGLRSGSAPTPDRGSSWSRLRDGFRYLGANPPLRGLIAAEGLAFVFFYFAVPVAVVFSKRTLHAGAGGYGAIMTAWGVGIVAGSLLQARMARRSESTMIVAATLAVAAGYLGTGVAPTLAVACAASVVGGIGNGTQWAAVETRVHRLVAEAFRARVAATLEALAAIAPGFGILAGGAIAASWSPRGAYLVAGAGLCTLVAASLVGGGSLFASGADPSPGPAIAAASTAAVEPSEGDVAQASPRREVGDVGRFAGEHPDRQRAAISSAESSDAAPRSSSS